ncbi:serine/threonine protein kinase [Streptomyces sp. NBC_00005]|uniref:serine/threonine protein kinase n=1 Tax=Streptomyces sp. NBC_00005 TaxID=2903609 RepID=UPI003244DBFC
MGEVFAGRYELVDPIGRGGVGAVWRAWDHRRRRYVAAKVLQQSDAHSLLRFVREQALRIDHPHVLAPASWAADDDKVLFTMDLVAGGSLVHLVGDYGPLPPAFVCTLLDQLLSGLSAVHAEGVVHRDVKPANVLLEATGTGRPRLRLSDFGIAMRLGEPRLTETNLVVGTPGYLAPEQMMGAEPDFPADLFAVGLVALYLLEGAKPDAKALVQYFAAHGTPSAPKGIPEPLWQVVATLLQPDPLARFRTATGARKALASATELLPEPGPDDELIEIFDQLGALPPGFASTGPLKPAPGVGARREAAAPGTGASEAPSWPVEAEASSRPSASDAAAVPSMGVAPPPDPRQDAGARPEPSVPGQPPSMSDTGSFHLPPPQATVSSARTPAPQTPTPHAQAQPHQGGHQQPAYVSPHDPTHVLPSPQSHVPLHPAQALTPAADQRADASTASYTAQVPQVPPSAQEISQETTRRNHRARPARRPGPPAKVAIPLLLLALTCYAVGFWALTRI